MSDLVYLKDEGVNAIHPEFKRRFATVKANFFSRNPDLWPVFHEPGFATLNEFRARGFGPGGAAQCWPDGRARLADLCETMPVPQAMRTPGEPMAELLFAGALSKDWENPSSVENVITMSADPAIYGAQMGILANPNLVYSEYAGVAEELEKKVVRQIALLAGYDPARATGIFTRGGRFVTSMATCSASARACHRPSTRGSATIRITASSTPKAATTPTSPTSPCSGSTSRTRPSASRLARTTTSISTTSSAP